MSDTLLRHIEMLSLIPVLPGKIAARDLHAKLQAEGYAADVRSIERDLHKLSVRFALVSDDARPAGWSWKAGQNPVRFPRMDAGTALTMDLVGRYLVPALPRSMLKSLEPEFAHARGILDALPQAPQTRWSRRIAVLPSGHQLLAPDVLPDVRNVVYDALLKGLRFEATYRSIHADEPWRNVFSPLGLACRESVVYLVATIGNYTDPRQFALQRMSKPSLLDSAASVPEHFDFERYVREEKSFDYPSGKTVRLELRVNDWLARQLEERRLSEDQTIAPIRSSENFRVTATVARTDQLYWWLRSFGPEVEIIKPTTWRRQMALESESLSRMYATKRMTRTR